MKIYKKKKMEDELEEQRTESVVLDLEEEAARLEKENKERKEALAREEETVEESN